MFWGTICYCKNCCLFYDHVGHIWFSSKYSSWDSESSIKRTIARYIDVLLFADMIVSVVDLTHLIFFHGTVVCYINTTSPSNSPGEL